MVSSRVAEASEVRRRDRAKGDAWIRAFLKRASFGFLATVEGGRPFLNSNLFVFDEAAHAIFIHTARRGRTPSNVEGGGPATFSAAVMGRLLPAPEALEFSVEYSGVVVFGTAAPVVEGSEKKRVLQLILDKYAPHLRPGRDYRPITAGEVRRTGVHRLAIEAWSGKEKVAAPEFPGAYLASPQLPPSVVGIEPTYHVVVVTASDGVLFTAVERSSEQATVRLGEYVRLRAQRNLWPTDAEAVMRLLDGDEIGPAVDMYFDRVGDRWDRELLHRQVL